MNMGNKYIDGHVHVPPTSEQLQQLIKFYDKYNIKKAIFAGLPWETGTNEKVIQCIKRYPERIAGLAYIDVDNDDINQIDKWLDRGFVGLKIIRTRCPYNHDKYMPFYERAQKYNAPILFHTGFLLHCEITDISCYRPIYVDTIARYFPKLRMILAHLGNPWWEEARLVISKWKNVYCDLSGGTLRQRSLDLLRNLFYNIEGVDYKLFRKVIFGTDGEMDLIVKYYQKICSYFKIPAIIQEQINYKNAFDLFFK